MNSVQQDIHKVPFLRLLLPYMAGLVMANEFEGLQSWHTALFFALGLMLLMFVHRRFSAFGNRQVFALSMFMVLFLGGVWRANLKEEQNKISDIRQKATYSAYVSSLPEEKTSSFLLELKLFLVDGEEIEPIKIWAYVDKNILIEKLEPGIWLQFNSVLNVPEHPALETEFDFASYLKSQGVYYTTYISHKNLVFPSIEPVRSVWVWNVKIRKKVLEILKRYQIEGEELALLSAITVGYKKLIKAEQQEAFAASGAMHILAVSGLHVGILYVMLLFTFGSIRKLRNGKVYFTLIVVIILWCFAFITGFSASVSRAALMFSLIAIGKVFSKQHYMINTIALSAFFLLLKNPDLLFQPGFQLSYAAVSGIVLVQTPLSQQLKISNKWIKKVVELISVSLIAQLATAPFTIYYFHRFALYSVLANLLVIPLVTLVLYTAIPLIVLGFVGIKFAILGSILNYLTKALNKSVHLVGSIPNGNIEALYFDKADLILVSALILSAIMFLYYPKKRLIYAGFVLLLTFTIKANWDRYRFMGKSSLVAYNSFGQMNVLIKDGEDGLVLSSDAHSQYVPTWFYANGVKEIRINPPEFMGNGVVLYRNFVLADKKLMQVLQHRDTPIYQEASHLLLMHKTYHAVEIAFPQQYVIYQQLNQSGIVQQNGSVDLSKNVSYKCMMKN